MRVGCGCHTTTHQQCAAQDISHALSIAETLGVLCKDDRARMEVTKQEHMRVVIPALVELARHCPPTDMEAVLNTLALLAQNQPQVCLECCRQCLVSFEDIWGSPSRAEMNSVIHH